jgi:hypothetical protein
MKKLIMVLGLILSSVFALGQDWSISVSPTANFLFTYHIATAGNAPQSPMIGVSSSLQYEFINDKKVSLGIGIGYQYGSVEFSPNYLGPAGEIPSFTESANLITASFMTVFKLRNQFYLSLDPLLDFQLNSDSPNAIENQTGLGLSFAAGKKIFRRESFYIRIEPRIWIHGIVPFNYNHQPRRLTVLGINIGVGLRK